ncbi:MAG: SLC13 family permease [Bacteroidota bacterium]
MSPFLILLIGLVVVLGLIIGLRLNAFLALITAALVVSLLAPGPMALKVERVAAAFGSTAASIGIVIALAAIIGAAMMRSGAADRIANGFLNALGEKRSSAAMAGSGFTLSIPVFFDTAFYLLVPLARSLARTTGRHYLRYLVAIAAGAAITHTLVPPTPGPLFMANRFGIDLGVMILVGLAVGLPSATAGLVFATWLDRSMPIPLRPYEGDEAIEDAPDEAALPGMALSLAPIALPILLITVNSVVKVLAQLAIPDAPLRDPELTTAILAAAANGLGIAQVFQWTNLLGNPNFALLLSAALAVWTYQRQQQPSAKLLGKVIESALMSGGVIILITAAGGAFGAMLRAAELGGAIQALFGDVSAAGLGVLLLAFGIASLLKFAQGSSTSAMIITAGMLGAMIDPHALPFHPIYLAMAIGGGSLVGSWMNDSGFWIFAKMGVLTEAETLKSWSPLLVVLGVTSFLITCLLALVLPLS